MKTYTYTVIYEQDEDGVIVATVPALPGCFTQGKTQEEAQVNVKDAIQAYLNSLYKHNEPIPEEPQEEVIGHVQINFPLTA